MSFKEFFTLQDHYCHFKKQESERLRIRETKVTHIVSRSNQKHQVIHFQQK